MSNIFMYIKELSNHISLVWTSAKNGFPHTRSLTKTRRDPHFMSTAVLL